jgi:hypothetical protein
VLACALVVGCARTEVVVAIASSELSAPGDFDRLSIKVTNPSLDPSGTNPLYAPPPLSICAAGQSSGCYALPLTVTLYPGSAKSDEKVRVEVQALHGSDALPAIAQAALFTFTKGASERLQFDLFRNCLNVECAQFDQACDAMGACSNVAPMSPNAPPDAGTVGGGTVVLMSASTLDTATVSSFDVPAPDSARPGDLLLLAASIGQNNSGDPAPESPGWTRRADLPPNRRMAIYVRVVGAGEPRQYTFTFPTSPSQTNWYLLQLRGARGLDGISALAENNPFFVPSVTTTFPGDLLVMFVEHSRFAGTCAAPAGSTLVGGSSFWAISTAIAGGAGPSGERHFDCSSNGVVDTCLAATFAIAPQ